MKIKHVGSRKASLFCDLRHNIRGGVAMKPFLQLNLQDNGEKAKAPDLLKPESEEPESQEALKRLNRMANRIAHKGANEYGRNTSGIFSK